MKNLESIFKDIYYSNNKPKLLEFSSEQFYHLLTNNLLKRHIDAKEHSKMIANVFGNIKSYQYDKNHSRVENVNTHLQDSSGN